MNTKKTFIIDYKAIAKNGSLIKDGTIKVKNKQTKFEAQCSLENYLEKKYANFGSMVIVKCTEDFMGIFGDIFGKGNPFQ